MLDFRKLTWKNFLSTGNDITEIDFKATPTTLVIGQNGAGKSTMLDALSFALFGKAHRDIAKAQLVNRINNKDCLVEVQFTVLGSEFRIVRGIKPNVFEIWKDGLMINQDSHTKDYQRVLEANILKLTHKSFHQIVVLGSSSFIPFMQLSTGHRRNVIEDLLDINVFSEMNLILKERSANLRDHLRELTTHRDIVTSKIVAHRKMIDGISKMHSDLRGSKLVEIETLRTEMSTINEQNASLSTQIEAAVGELTPKHGGLTTRAAKLREFRMRFQTESDQLDKNTKFFETNCTCPTCTQDIDVETKYAKVSAFQARLAELSSGLTQLDAQITATSAEIQSLDVDQANIRASQQMLHSNTQEVSSIERRLKSTAAEIAKMADTSEAMMTAQMEMDLLISSRNEVAEKLLVANDEFAYNGAIAEMLKDTGIKTKIVKQYIPVINQLVNKYLQMLDFFVSFTLDESFTESIRSRHRDNFTYHSFSEGEKQRIDLALLFTWRSVARMKNSVATNLLILDETFDASLDYDGVDNLMKIIYTLEHDTNVFVISHKADLLEGRFANKIEFIKDKNFSKIKGT